MGQCNDTESRQISQLRDENVALKREIQELKQRNAALAKNTSNSKETVPTPPQPTAVQLRQNKTNQAGSTTVTTTTRDEPIIPVIPPPVQGWRAVCTADGKIYYQNDNTKQTQWTKPIAMKNNESPVIGQDLDPNNPSCVCGTVFGPVQSARGIKCNHCNKVTRAINIHMYSCRNQAYHGSGTVYNQCTRCWKKRCDEHEKKQQTAAAEDETYVRAFCASRKMMTLDELETLIDHKHQANVRALLEDNLKRLILKPKGRLGWEVEACFDTCNKIMNLVKGTQPEKYYAFYCIDFLFHEERILKPEYAVRMLFWMEALIVPLVNGSKLQRISEASVWGMEAVLINRMNNNMDFPQYFTKQFLGFYWDNYQTDPWRAKLQLIRKGMGLNPNDRYCAYALARYYANEAKHRVLEFAKIADFGDRPAFTEWIKDTQKEVESEIAKDLKQNKWSRLEYQATSIARAGKYDEGLQLYEDAVGKVENDRLEMYLSKLKYILSYGYDYRDMKRWDKIVNDAFDQTFVFFYLPDNFRNDPVHDNVICASKGATWIYPENHQWDESLGDKCKTHGFLFVHSRIQYRENAIKEWANDEEYTLKWKYSLNEMLDLIDKGAKQINANNIDLVLAPKSNGDDIPLFWDTLIALWAVLSGRYGGDEDVVSRYKHELLSQIWYKICPIHDYICNHAHTEEGAALLIEYLDELWRKSLHYNDTYCREVIYKQLYKLIHFTTYEADVEVATLMDEEEQKTTSHESESIESKVEVLKFLNEQWDTSKINRHGWLEVCRMFKIEKAEIMKEIKAKYQTRLDTLSSKLTSYYKELTGDPNYDQIVSDIQQPADNEMILRQDSKSVLQRCRWGPLVDDTLNKERYKEDMNSKYGLTAVDDVSREPIKNSFKNSYVDYVIKIGDKLQVPFQTAMRELFANTNGEYCEAPVKKFERCLQKINYDYKDEKEPVGAHILDIVRCLVVYENMKDMSDAFDKLQSKYKVCRLKNNFVQNATVFGNYRCLMVNILFEHPTKENIKMICEVQLTLRKIYQVRLTMHKTYKLFRAILPEDDAMLF
eukprot:179885_1